MKTPRACSLVWVCLGLAIATHARADEAAAPPTDAASAVIVEGDGRTNATPGQVGLSPQTPEYGAELEIAEPPTGDESDGERPCKPVDGADDELLAQQLPAVALAHLLERDAAYYER